MPLSARLRRFCAWGAGHLGTQGAAHDVRTLARGESLAEHTAFRVQAVGLDACQVEHRIGRFSRLSAAPALLRNAASAPDRRCRSGSESQNSAAVSRSYGLPIACPSRCWSSSSKFSPWSEA